MRVKDDIFLLYEIKSGNEQAFKHLFSIYYKRLLGYAKRFIPDTYAVEDIVQDVFLKIWERHATLEQGSLSSLLFTMVRNHCINYLKHLAIMDICSVDYLENLDGEERLYHCDFCSNGEMDLLYKELKAQIPIVLNQLPKRSREIFVMSRMKSLKNREIAEKLSISTTAVEKHIARAIAAFEQHFKKKYSLGIGWIWLLMAFFMKN